MWQIGSRTCALPPLTPLARPLLLSSAALLIFSLAWGHWCGRSYGDEGTNALALLQAERAAAALLMPSLREEDEDEEGADFGQQGQSCTLSV